MSEYDIYLTFNTPERENSDYEGVSLRLPVLPEQLQFVRGGDNVSSSTVKHGEVNVLRRPKLTTFQIDSFFPRTGERGYVRGREEFYSPDYYMTMLTWLQDNKTPAKAVFSGFDIEAMYVSVESFTFSYNHADDDITYSLSLKEYRPYGANSRRLVALKPLFSGSNATAYSAVRPARPKTSFSIGDRVIVNGLYFRDAYGGVAFLPTPMDFMCQNYKIAVVKGVASIRNAPAQLLEQEAVIIGIKRNGKQLIKSSLPGGVQNKTELGVLFPYQIAVDQKAVGWVAKSSLRHAL